MGYYTYYKLETEPAIHTMKELETFLNEDDDFSYALYSGEPSKWYEHEENMRDLSKKYPDVLFQLKGEGEEAGDVWKKYFKNGKMQHCPAKISFDEYDENKLK